MNYFQHAITKHSISTDKGNYT